MLLLMVFDPIPFYEVILELKPLVNSIQISVPKMKNAMVVSLVPVNPHFSCLPFGKRLHSYGKSLFFNG